MWLEGGERRLQSLRLARKGESRRDPCSGKGRQGAQSCASSHGFPVGWGPCSWQLPTCDMNGSVSSSPPRSAVLGVAGLTPRGQAQRSIR